MGWFDRRWATRVLVTASFACEPAVASPPPTPPEAAGPATVERAATSPEPVAEQETSASVAEQEASEPEPEPDGAEAASTPPPAESAPQSAPPSDKPLPKPIHARIDVSCGRDPDTGTKLRPFELKSIRGKTISDRTYGSRVQLVNFWGTWCEPCLEELPEFDRLYRRYRSHGLTLVAIATDEEAGPVEAFASRRKIAAKLLLGGQPYAETYSSTKFPFTLVVAPGGEIVASYHGFRPECMGRLEADIRAALQQSHEAG